MILAKSITYFIMGGFPEFFVQHITYS